MHRKTPHLDRALECANVSRMKFWELPRILCKQNQNGRTSELLNPLAESLVEVVITSKRGFPI